MQGPLYKHSQTALEPDATDITTSHLSSAADDLTLRNLISCLREGERERWINRWKETERERQKEKERQTYKKKNVDHFNSVMLKGPLKVNHANQAI